MLVRFTKHPAAIDHDSISCVRLDGTSTSGQLARRGVLPHEAIHFVVETTMGWRDAFFGRVAAGDTLENAGRTLHDPRIDWAKHVQGLQCEALVACLEAEQWGGPSDPATFALKLITDCRRAGVTPPDIDADEVARVRTALREFGAAWRPLLPGQSLDRTF